ncbi:MAG TPA: prephenate dehydrogenase [Pyrinomonadaceae bacterium]|jgi:prephenate dehydrogenase
MSPEQLLIIGGNGRFGTLLSNLLSHAGHVVNGIDLQHAPASEARFSRYVSSDVLSPSPEATSLIQESGCIVLSLPEEVTLNCFPGLVEVLKEGSLLVDLLSVKSAIVTLMKNVEKPVELLSLHPMFAPQVGFAGQNVVAIEVRPGRRTAALLTLLKSFGARLTLMTADQHDAATAAIQVATHAALISFGLALRGMNYDVEQALSVSAPPHRLMLMLFARILAGDPEIYWRIQVEHPLSASTRDVLKQSLVNLNAAISEHDFETFKALLESARVLIAPEQENLISYGAQVMKVEM